MAQPVSVEDDHALALQLQQDEHRALGVVAGSGLGAPPCIALDDSPNDGGGVHSQNCFDDEDLALALQMSQEGSRGEESDYQLALSLQNELNDGQCSNGRAEASQSLSIVDKSLETTDPNPNIRELFLQYNDSFFFGRLSGVEVKWSRQMTL